MLQGGSPSTSPSRIGRSTVPSVPLAHSKLHHGPDGVPKLEALDLTAVADSSTGGGGIPRPYGKFIAQRQGDGRALWQRLPPKRGSWRAKALPV